MFDPIRLWRTPRSFFGSLVRHPDDLLHETATAAVAYTDDCLAEIAQQGFNGIWVHAVLRDLVRPSVFPELAPNRDLHLERLRDLIARAASHDLKVYLYMQPPRGWAEDDPFILAHPEVAGTPVPRTGDDQERFTMLSSCTSTQPVKTFLREGAEELARALPELGGVILITASEYPAHCYSKYPYVRRDKGEPLACPRCRERHPADVVNEVIRMVRDGIRAVSQEMAIICWNWSWTMYDTPPCRRILSGLPEDVIVMAGFERGGQKTIYGRDCPVDEYSLSYIGPSKQFLATHEACRQRGLPLMAKLQIGTTHELATVASLPLIGNLYDKAQALHQLNILHIMGCWNFGNMSSTNTLAFVQFLDQKKLMPRHHALGAFARESFPGCDPASLVAAWTRFSEAMAYYPFSVPFLYFSPINYTLVYPLRPGPISEQAAGRSWLPDSRGDNLEQSLRGFELDEVIDGLGHLQRAWQTGLYRLCEATVCCRTTLAELERSNARCCYHVFRSAWNTYRVYRLRRNWQDERWQDYRDILEDELSNLRAAEPVVRGDARLGFHAECQEQFFDADGIAAKIADLEQQLAPA